MDRLMIRPRNVTVCIATIPGREDLLARALDSVQAQTVTPQRVLVVCDVERRGAWWTRNQLLRQTRTAWVAWLDDDDEMLPGHLQTLIEGGNESGADLIYSYPQFAPPDTFDPLATVDDDGRVVASPIGIGFGARQEQWLRERGNFIPVTTLTRTALLRQVGGFPEPGSMPVQPGNNSAQCEDYLVLLKLLDAGARFHHVPVVSWTYHVSPAQTGGRGTDR
jgi:hypothetical protein